MTAIKEERQTRHRLLVDEAMQATDQAEAARILEDLVAIVQEIAIMSKRQARANVRETLGYHAARFGESARERVERLFACEHPIFGAIAEVEPPTHEEALALGRVNSIGAPVVTLAALRARARERERERTP